METKKDKWFLWIVFPLAGILFFALASYLYFLPELRFQQAEEAFQNADYETAVRLIGKENSERTALMMDRILFEKAQKCVEEGNREEARSILKNLPETKEVSGLLQRIAYEEAMEAFSAGRWSEAIEKLQPLKGYQDAYVTIDRARAAIAEERYQQGQGAQAVEELLALGDDSYIARAYEIAVEVTGIEDPEEALTTIRGLDPETVQRLKRMRQKQKEAQTTILAAGFFHTVGIKADGTVLACGDNTKKQCSVENWSDIIEIAAGAYHTVGLKSDGTVTATGDNSFGQCDVGTWTDIVHIAANNYDTIALTKNGQVLHTGYHAYPEIDAWPSDIVSICAGSYAAGALRKNGQLLTTHESNEAPEFAGLIFSSVQTGYSLGLTEEGVPVSHGVTLPADWEGLTALYGGTNRVIALTAEGTVFEFAFLERDALLPEPQPNIRAVANAATHIALLQEDGNVRCFGENQYGECNTENWNLLG